MLERTDSTARDEQQLNEKEINNAPLPFHSLLTLL